MFLHVEIWQVPMGLVKDHCAISLGEYRGTSSNRTAACWRERLRHRHQLQPTLASGFAVGAHVPSAGRATASVVNNRLGHVHAAASAI